MAAKIPQTASGVAKKPQIVFSNCQTKSVPKGHINIGNSLPIFHINGTEQVHKHTRWVLVPGGAFNYTPIVGPIISKSSSFCTRNRVYTMIMAKINELRQDKTNKIACAPSEDPDQPRHPPSWIRVFVVRMKKPWVLTFQRWRKTYHNDPKFSDRQVWANSVDPDQTAKGAV